LFRFAKDQSAINVAGVRMGGQPGEYPTALAGTIFYQGHKIVENHEEGIFDRGAAELLISRQADLSQETGNPAIVHLFAITTKAFSKYLEFLDSVWDGPVILDSIQPEVRAGMARMVTELGYADKCIYNSINVGTSEIEEEAIAQADLDSAILLAYHPSQTGVDGCMHMLEDGAGLRKEGLISFARRLGMKNLLIDPGVRPLGEGAGSTLRFSVVAKARLGLPVGCGMHNAASSWGWLKGQQPVQRRCCDAATAAMQIVAGGDYLLYGPIENAPTVFPVAAMADIMIAEAVSDLDVLSVADHPRFLLI
jgi:tetrahydromethanopterin S-methyltransferase subunit H